MIKDRWQLRLMKRPSVEAGFRPLFRFQNLSAVTIWLALVLVMALFIDRPVIAAIASSPTFVEALGHLLEPFGNSIFPIIGGGGAIVLCFGVGLSFARGPMRRLFWSLTQLAAMVSLSALWAGLLVRVLKALLGRPRPTKWLEDGLYHWLPAQFQHLHVSMPSGHTATVFTMAFIVSVFLPKYRVAIIAFAALVGMGRVMTLHHWPSDIMMGAVLGWFFARGVASLFVGSDRILVQRLNGDFLPSRVWKLHRNTIVQAIGR